MAKETIKLKNYSDVLEEYTAASTIIPGELIELISAGTVRPHATEGGNALPMFAVEDALQGNGIDDTYASGDKVQCWIPTRGDIVNAILEDGATVNIGDFLVSNGAGMLQKLVDVQISSQAAETVYPASIVGIALEYKDLSGSSGEGSAGESSVGTLGYNKRIQIRIV